MNSEFNSTRPINSIIARLTIVSAIAAFCFAGCTREDELLDVVETNVARVKVDDLTRSIRAIKGEVRRDQKEFREQVANGLNRWVSYSEKDLEKSENQWTLDPKVGSLVEQFQGLEVADRISDFQFLSTDPFYLQQCYWITELTKRIDQANRLKTFEFYRFAADNYRPSQDDENPIQTVFKKLHPDLSDDEMKSLVRAVKIFDWVCRNVQLESDAALTDQEKRERELDPSKPSGPASGLPGLGYQRLPWEVLMFGRGDYVERAKLMMTCLHYWDIDSVLLATGDEARPWAVGVSIGGQYYLFDTKLALPIPGKKIGTIATLDQVRGDGSLLTGLDLTTDESLAENTKYWVKPEDIKQLTALIYASPEAVSKRAKGVEDSLVGEDRLKLSFKVSDVIERLPTTEGVEAKVWDIGFKTHQYRNAVRTAFAQSSTEVQDRLIWFIVNEEYINQFGPYRTARGRFLTGKFKTKDDERGLDAIEGWQKLVYDDDTIASLGSDTELQRIHGIRKSNQSNTEFENEIAAIQAQMRFIRVDAKLFLAECLFDNANENAAGSWLEDLSSDEDSDRWNEAVTYLLGRSYESRGDYDNAVKTFGDESRLQAHGNLLRARMIKQLIEEVYGSE